MDGEMQGEHAVKPEVQPKRDRGILRIDGEECKGCGLCVEACPPKVIAMNEQLNHYGYRTAMYAGKGCTACGICFMVCPEPGAITVLQLIKRAVTSASVLRESTGRAEPCASN